MPQNNVKLECLIISRAHYEADMIAEITLFVVKMFKPQLIFTLFCIVFVFAVTARAINLTNTTKTFRHFSWKRSGRSCGNEGDEDGFKILVLGI